VIAVGVVVAHVPERLVRLIPTVSVPLTPPDVFTVT
jgi:hypothetical protein